MMQRIHAVAARAMRLRLLRSEGACGRTVSSRSLGERAVARGLHPARAIGFTLIELLMVIVVILILVGLLMVALSAAKNNAKRRRALVECRAIVTAIRTYHFTERAWPCPDADMGRDDDSASAPIVYYDHNMYVINRLIAPTPHGPALLDISDFKTNVFAGATCLIDPWNLPYLIWMDLDYDDTAPSRVTVPLGGGRTATVDLSGDRRDGVGVRSLGWR